jgi:hypothetical protein
MNVRLDPHTARAELGQCLTLLREGANAASMLPDTPSPKRKLLWLSCLVQRIGYRLPDVERGDAPADLDRSRA